MFILIIIWLQMLYDSLCFWSIYNEQTAEVTPNGGLVRDLGPNASQLVDLV